ncbi:hypothetical protein DNU06_05955 [Putridiphycobacter roseus]|uniref:Uncharacterized protein n=1 Tax=Putridiphycobacter roseus TaxID=2219161 RepID=A0A2W1NTT7_9FLAO|nr:DUF6428 family protein [Putridiphycobacter roseus]PZE18158.1 hypothetical protein DNU06_05955 [Putridiphycobacter roseus]
MKLSAFKNILKDKTNIAFELPNGSLVPNHFHVTEVGQINKRFIDCGGTMRDENVVNFQLWEANDYDHRLHPNKLIDIIELSESKLGITDEEIEVEYQGETIGKFGLEYAGGNFLLTSKTTDCLAKDKCGIPEEKIKVSLKALTPDAGDTCTPGGGCC